MNALITGGTGVIGRALTEELVNNNHTVSILTRDPEKTVPGATSIQWDLKPTHSWAQHVENADAVIHLAGENLAGDSFLPSRWTQERKTRIINSRVQTGEALTAAIAQANHKPKVFIQASAIGYYGPRGAEIVREEEQPGDDFLAQVCLKWEHATAGVERLGVRRIILRTGIVLTPESGALARLLLPYRIFLGGPFGNGRHYYAWIHIADEIAAIRYLMENPHAAGAYNLTAPQPLTNKDFGNILGKILGRPSWLPIPRFALAALLGEVSTVVFEGQRAVPDKLVELGYPFKFPDLESALINLLRKEA